MQLHAAPNELPEPYRDADAVILDWRQSWNKSPDGTVTHRERKSVLIQNDRAIRAFADPRIAYNADFETVNIMKATTRSPEIPVPDYSRNIVSPFAAAGWPAFAPTREIVISFSGIRPGSIVDLEYEKITKPGMNRFLEIECRLHQEYPTLSRRIEFPGQEPRKFTNIDPIPEEPQSIPWRERQGYLWFSDCPDEKTWARSVLDELRTSAASLDVLRSTAKEWTKGKKDALEKAAAVQEKLKSRISLVNVPPDWSTDAIRPAKAVLASHYASEPEAGALLLAMFRAAGLVKVMPFFIVQDESAGHVRDTISAYGVVLETPSGRSFWHIDRGFIRTPGPWAGARLYEAKSKSDDGIKPPARLAIPEENKLTVNARVTVDDKASWTAELDLRTTGLILPESSLRNEEEKKAAVSEIVGDLLPDAELEAYTVTALSDDVFAVTAKAKSKEPLPQEHGRYFFTLPERGPWARRFPIPLERSRRETTLRLAAPFEYEADFAFEETSGWSLIGGPDVSQRAMSGDVTINQCVINGGRRIEQRITFRRRDIPPGDFSTIRDALNDLQTHGARTIVFSPKSPSAS